MGKKSNKQLKEQRRAQLEEQRAQNRKQSLRVLLATLCVILALALLISGGVLGGTALYNVYLDSGKPYRSIVSYKTESYQIDNAMLSFYFYDYLYNGLLDKLGMKHPDELKDNYFTFTDEETNKDEKVSYLTYYNELAALEFQTALVRAEAAEDFGIRLGEREQSFIENRIKGIEQSAAALGLKTKDYIARTYGRGVKISDIRKTLEITHLADKLYATLYGGAEITEGEIRTFLTEHDLNYTKVDYYLHVITMPANATEAERKAALEQAEKLMACTDDEAFLKELKAQLSDMYGEEEGFDVDKEVESLIMSEFVQPISDKTTDLDRFLYDPDSKEGQNFLSVGERSYGIARIVKEQYSADEPLETLRLIRLDYNNFSSKADALSAMSALKKALQGKSEAEFANAALTESHDLITALQKGFYPLDSAEDTVESLVASKLATAKKGDLLEFSNGQSLWLAYYCGKGLTASEAYAASILRAEKYNEQADGLAEKYPMEYDISKITRLAPLYSKDAD